MNLSYILKLVLFIEIIVLLGNAVVISRDYQDSWVLEGLEIPFVVFVITYVITFFTEKRVTWIVALTAICSSVFVLIPNLKYVWFSGRSIDQHAQYSLAKYLYDEGHIMPNARGTQMFYTGTPLMHLSFGIFSMVANIPLLSSFKFLPVLWSSINPLLTYSVVRNLGFRKESTVLRYALFISSIPIDPALSYVVTGSLFGRLLSFLFVLHIVRLLRKNDRRDWSLLIFFGVALVTAHSFYAVQLGILILIILLLQKFSSSFRIKSYFRTSTIFLLLVLNLGWLLFEASGTLKFMLAQIVDIGIPRGGYISPRFSELFYVNIFETLKVTLVFQGADTFLLLVIIASLILVVKKRNWSNSLKFLWLFNTLVLLSFAFGLLGRVSADYWVRIVRIQSISYAIFFGILILYVGKGRIRSLAVVSFLLIIMVLAPVQHYRFQPLICSANIISRNLPTDEPLVYVGPVNSIYQREMIWFAQDHIRGRIASDRVTRNQIKGLATYNFSRTFVVGYYPFSRLLNETATEIGYDYFLIHLPGKSGAFEEQAEIRTRSLMLDALNNPTHSVVYSNTESYILAKS